MNKFNQVKEKLSKAGAGRPWRKSIFLSTAVFSWVLVVCTLGIFLCAVIPYQRNILVGEMESKARAIGTSIAQVTAGSIVLEDYSSVVDHCMKILKERPSILYLVVTRKDGFSLVSTAENWNMENRGKEWIPSLGQTRQWEFIESQLVGEKVFSYTYPFSYSGIDWGWIHIGLSTRHFYSELSTIYLRTFWLFLLCILGGLAGSLLFARRLSRPILYLNRITQRVGSGDLSAKAEINSGDEVEKLADSLNQMTQSLRKSREELIAGRDHTGNIIKSMGESLMVLQADMTIKQVNKATCELLGYDEEELVGHSAAKVFVNGDFREMGVINLIKTGRVTDLETAYQNSSGKSIPVLFSSRAMKDDKGKLEGIVVITRDITERKHAEHVIKVSEERYRRLVNNMPDTVFALDLKGNFTFSSPRVLQLTGYPLEKILSMNIFQLIAPQYHTMVKEGIARRIKGEEFPPYELEFVNAQGNRFFVQMATSASCDAGGEIIGIQGIARDISQQKNLERQLFHSQKMDAIGKLAGGIAHDFNNLLAALLGNLELAKLDIDPGHPATPSLNTMQEAGRRATELVKQLLQFGRPSRTDEKVISLSEMVEESIGFLRAVIPTTIKFEKEFPENPCLIKADPSVVTQIVTNLSVNARDAMPEGGKLRFCTREITVDEAYCKTNLEAAPGEYCVLEISDTGAGMPASIRERIFEPFFTTKERSMGTGLGLSMVYGVVKQMGGWIQLHSEPGVGTEFEIFLPKTNDNTRSEEEIPAVKARGGEETILLADDEEMVLNMGRRILERYGYRVLTAKDGREAVDLFTRKKKEIALAILDLTMPGCGGLTAMEEIHKISRDFPVIISSGYSSDQVWKKAKQRARAFLPKPYPPIKMAGIVRQVLDSTD